MIVKRQHFVPQGYLKLFCNNKRKLNIFDKNTSKSFALKTKDAMVESHIYSIEDSSTSEYLKWLLILQFKGIFEYEGFKTMFQYIVGESSVFVKSVSNSEIATKLNEYLNGSVKRIDRLENFFEYFENRFYKARDSIFTNKETFVNHNINYNDILGYLSCHAQLFCNQQQLVNFNNDYVQTKLSNHCFGKTKDNLLFDIVFYMSIQSLRVVDIHAILKNISTQKNISFTKVDMLTFMIFASINFANNICNDLQNNGYQFIIINNKTNTSFITSDRPCINLLNPTETNDVKLFFPICKNIAIYIAKLPQKYKNNILDIEVECENTIANYNTQVMEKSKRFYTK